MTKHIRGEGDVRAVRSAAWRVRARGIMTWSACVWLHASCSDADEMRASDAVHETDAGVDALAFSACPLVTAPGALPAEGALAVPAELDDRASQLRLLLAATDQLEGFDTAQAECASAQLPAEWNEPQGDSIEVFVKRYPAREQPAQGQLWMLQGGPGNAGSTLEALSFVIADSIPTLDIYLPDHRGTGRSSRATCEEGTTGLGYLDCVQNLEHPNGLTITDAARDLAWLIDASAKPSQPVYIFAVSYGTAWAQRYLQIEPDQATAVILDSTQPPEYDWAESNKNDDAMARRILAMCRDNADCSDKLGAEPVAAAEQAIAKVSTGECTLPSSVPSLSGYFGALVGAGPVGMQLLPASIHRVLRCDDADKEWIEKVANHLAWTMARSSPGASPVLFLHILLSELWNTEASIADLVREQNQFLAQEDSARFMWLAGDWPKYPRDEHYGKWPDTSLPILVLQGGLDALLPYGDLARAHYTGEQQYYVEVPYAGHAVMVAETRDLSAPLCGFQVIQSFLADQSRAPDTSCVADVPAPDFSQLDKVWLDLIGIADVWENP